jgi:hypothetical protein
VKSSGNRLFYSIVIAILVALGFLRDFIFIGINTQLSKLYYKEINGSEYDYQLPASLSFFNDLGYSSLSKWKWALSFVFTGVYFIIGAIVIKRIFPAQRLSVRIVAAAHVVLIVLAGIFYLAGVISGNWKGAYPLSLTFSHFAQSPVVLMVLIPAFKLMEMSDKRS